MTKVTDHKKLRAWLAKHAKDERDANLVFAHEVEGKNLGDAAREAGYSAGRSDDPEAQYRHLAAAGSRAMGSQRVRRLLDAFRTYRAHGDQLIATEREVLARLSEIVRTSSDASVIQAAKGLLDHHRRAPSTSTPPNQLPALVDEAVSRSNPLLQSIAISTALIQRDGGNPHFRDWQVPDHAKHIERSLRVANLSPFDVVRLVLVSDEQ